MVQGGRKVKHMKFKGRLLWSQATSDEGEAFVGQAFVVQEHGEKLRFVDPSLMRSNARRHVWMNGVNSMSWTLCEKDWAALTSHGMCVAEQRFEEQALGSMFRVFQGAYRSAHRGDQLRDSENKEHGARESRAKSPSGGEKSWPTSRHHYLSQRACTSPERCVSECLADFALCYRHDGRELASGRPHW